VAPSSARPASASPITLAKIERDLKAARHTGESHREAS
jgi:hypothetical protein